MASVLLRAVAVEGKFEPHPRGRHGRTPKQVAAHQRQRIFDAILELVVQNGYPAVKPRDVAKRARISRERIRMVLGVGGQEDIFLWALDLVIAQATTNAEAAYRAETDWQDQLQSGFYTLMNEVLGQPNAARVALVEAYSAGPTAVHRMEQAAFKFEAMLSATFAANHVELHPIIAQGVVGGIQRVVRQRLLDNALPQLRAETDTLLEWILAYHTEAGKRLKMSPVTRTSRSVTAARLREVLHTPDDRGAMMLGAAEVVAQGGYDSLGNRPTALFAELADDTFISFSAFLDLFPGGTEECLLAAYDRIGADVIDTAAKAARSTAGDWPKRVIAGVDSIIWRIANDPVFARLAFIEVFKAGPPSLPHRTKLVQSFSNLLMAEAPEDRRPSTVISEAIVGAVWQLAHHAVTNDAAHRLLALREYAAYLVLAPLIGADAAVQEIREAA